MRKRKERELTESEKQEERLIEIETQVLLLRGGLEVIERKQMVIVEHLLQENARQQRCAIEMIDLEDKMLGRKSKKKKKCFCCGAPSHRGLCDKCAFGKCPKGIKH